MAVPLDYLTVAGSFELAEQLERVGLDVIAAALAATRITPEEAFAAGWHVDVLDPVPGPVRRSSRHELRSGLGTFLGEWWLEWDGPTVRPVGRMAP